MEKDERKTVEDAERRYSGVATDVANDDQVSQKLVDEETKQLNNNPRNDN